MNHTHVMWGMDGRADGERREASRKWRGTGDMATAFAISGSDCVRNCKAVSSDGWGNRNTMNDKIRISKQ